MAIDFNQLRELLAAIAGTDIAELTLKSDDFELTVRKGIPTMPMADQTVVNTAAMISATPPAMPIAPTQLQPSPATSAATPTSPPVDQKWVAVKSPMVGTFYRSPAPDEPAFVEVSDRIRSDQTVCIIEAMKLMNEIEAEVSGQVMEILVKNGDPVEYGQALMLINPD
jgi:acetyl-CoA carboxylase biotin carboxyl carrier protein